MSRWSLSERAIADTSRRVRDHSGKTIARDIIWETLAFSPTRRKRALYKWVMDTGSEPSRGTEILKCKATGRSKSGQKQKQNTHCREGSTGREGTAPWVRAAAAPAEDSGFGSQHPQSN